jgi:hypothetical protein
MENTSTSTKFNFASIKRDAFKVHNGFDRETNPYRDSDPDRPQFQKFGADNQYPEYLISLYNQSSTHASCVNAIVQAITGDGLVTENEEILENDIAFDEFPEEETEAIYQALSKLPYEQRETIVLHLHGAMTFKQIAQQGGVSINTAQGHYRYGQP